MYNRFLSLGEYYAAGFYEEVNKSYFERYARALRRHLEHRELPPYNGEPLYPCGNFETEHCVRPDYSFTVSLSRRLWEKDAEAAERIKKEIDLYTPSLPKEHRIGGTMYTHSFPNFRRLVREGLDSYEARIQKMKREDLRDGLMDVLAGIRAFHCRALDLLYRCGAEETELYQALLKVPFGPATTLYEALVAWNFIYYMDGCDNIGRLDADLIDFYRGEDVTAVLRRLFQNVDDNSGWSGALGPDYNELTLQCLAACKGMRRPGLELRVTPDMPPEIWQAALEAVRAGGGSPSFYNEEKYQRLLCKLFPSIPEEDRLRFCGGGCTETMLTGLSNVGSLDAGVNVALIFERFLRKHLPDTPDFETFYRGFIKECHAEIDVVLDSVSTSQQQRARYRPQPMRTLLIDDCIQKERDFNDGGARYRWSVINLAGIINVLDSLLVIRELLQKIGGSGILAALDAGESFRQNGRIPRHGNGDESARSLAARLSKDLCAAFEGKEPYSGGRFLPASIQFTRYVDAGKNVGATPDGRRAGDPLCDSIGSIHGADQSGPTALLSDAAVICSADFAGTPVLNLKLDAAQSIEYLRPLVEGYFAQGGMQLQVTCVDQEALLKAKDHPELYPNLIVRIGGYSEYFARLSPELRQTVVDRMLYSK